MQAGGNKQDRKGMDVSGKPRLGWAGLWNISFGFSASRSALPCKTPI
jgi:hypothetical protein